jgi:hypothetical protein
MLMLPFPDTTITPAHLLRKQSHLVPKLGATPPVWTVVMTALHRWTSPPPENCRTNATMMNGWLKDSAFIADWQTISRTNAQYWQATMAERSVWPLQASLPLKQTLSPPPVRLGKRLVYQQPIGSVGGPIPTSSFISAQEILYVSANSLSNKEESELDGNHLIILCTLSDHDIKIDTHALVNCCCTGFSFMNDEFTHRHNFPHYQSKTQITVEIIDG